MQSMYSVHYYSTLWPHWDLKCHNLLHLQSMLTFQQLIFFSLPLRFNVFRYDKHTATHTHSTRTPHLPLCTPKWNKQANELWILGLGYRNTILSSRNDTRMWSPSGSSPPPPPPPLSFCISSSLTQSYPPTILHPPLVLAEHCISRVPSRRETCSLTGPLQIPATSNPPRCISLIRTSGKMQLFNAILCYAILRDK